VPSTRRRVASVLHRHGWLRLVLLLALPMLVLVVVYLGALAVLLLSAFWSTDTFTGDLVRTFTPDNFREVVTNDTYRAVTLRTVGVAATVTVVCAVLAFPMAFYMAKVASPRARRILVVAVLTPLWASYLVKAFAWRAMLAGDGVVNWALDPVGLRGPGFGLTATVIVLSYLWLPFMILPVYAGLERIPSSLLEASADLGGKSVRTFFRVTLPLAFPAVVAGSIFTFSLTLGDYIAPKLITSQQFIGTVIYDNHGTNLPVAAAFTLVPIAVMVVYLLVARRLKAFEAL
jgi:putative spermidine/putrescine transport system permease protein